MTRQLEYDVVVVGAGTAGAATAYHCASRGLATALVDANPFERSGAHWVNGVPPWMFERAGIPIPTGAEHRAAGHRALLLDHCGKGDLWIEPTPLMDVDMRLLVERLQGMAAEAGVAAHPSVRIERAELEGDRPVALVGRAAGAGDGVADEELVLRAKLFVDATGLGAFVRRLVPALDRLCPEVKETDICDATQQTRHIADRDAARAWLDRHGAGSGDAVSYLGVEGGFSTLTLNLDLEEGHVEILTGAMATNGYASSLELIERFERDHPWMGEVIHGGTGLIPLRRPYDRISTPGLALVGNSGCMVFPAHGSGIGSGMIAGRMLAEAAAAHDDPGGAAAMWSYGADFMREVGSVNAAYDIFRRTSQELTSEEIAAMLACGLMSRATSQAALEQRMPRFTPAEVANMGLAAVRGFGIAVRMIPSVLRTDRIYRHYRRYPTRPDEAALALWAEQAARLCA